jgi:serine/threonine-protein kinase
MRPRFELAHLWSLDILSGDFEAARGRALELERSIASAPERRLHARAAWWWASASIESGRDADGARKAQEFFRREGAWTAEPRHDDFAMLRDPAPRLLAAERRAGLISQAELERDRAKWLQSWGSGVPDISRTFLWLHGYAAASETADDARAALDEEPHYGIPQFTPNTLGDAYVGHVYLLAGRPADALPYLRRATAACVAVESPLEHTQAHLALAQALVATGARDQACAPLRVVLGRWGHARPRSITADKARALARSLGCP